jgi:hypothetical protein
MDPALVSNEGEGAAGRRPVARSQRRIEECEVRQVWPISAEQRQAICDRLMGIIKQEPDAGPPVPIRYVLQAARALITADGVNLEQDKRQRRVSGPDASVRGVATPRRGDGTNQAGAIGLPRAAIASRDPKGNTKDP